MEHLQIKHLESWQQWILLLTHTNVKSKGTLYFLPMHLSNISLTPCCFAFLGIIPWTPAWQLLTSAQWPGFTSKRCEDYDKNPGCQMRDSNMHDQETKEMADRSINTERNYSAGTDNLQKSGHTIRECRHQVSYTGTTTVQGEDGVTGKCWEDIFPRMAPALGREQQQPSLASFSSGSPV